MNPKIKISQLPAKGSNLAAADLLEVAEFTGTGYISKSITGQEIIDAAVGNVDWGDIGGTLSDQTDLNTALSGKVPTTRTLTINGTTQDLSADRTFTISTGITIGTTAITSGTVGRVLFEGTGNVVQESSSFTYDDTLKVFTITGTIGSVLQHTALSNYNGLGGFQLNVSGGTERGFLKLNPTTGEVRIGATGSGYFPTFYAQGVEAMRIFASTRNIGVNTTTDAGYKLDVNGTARVSGNLTLGAEIFGTTNTYFNGPTLNTGTLRLRFGSVFSNGAFTVDGLVQGLNVTASSANAGITATGSGVPAFIISNTTSTASWRIESHRTTSGALEFKNDLSNPTLNLFASRSVGIGTFTDVASSLLTLESTTKGFLPPRMTTTQKNAIATPAAGLMVYDTTLNLISVYNGTTWITL